MNIKHCFQVLILILAFCFYSLSVQAQQDLRVIIIRHAEKPTTGDNLSCAGFDRALKLPAVIKAKFGVPNYLYVPTPSTGKTTKVLRMLQTISPLAVKYNLQLNTNYDVTQTAKLAANIIKKEGTVLVVWEHNNIPAIATALGIKKKKLKWPGSDFDGIWVVTFHNGQASLSSDAEGIKPAANCTF